MIFDKMKEADNLDGLFLNKDANVRYITGFPGEDCFVLIAPEGKFLLTDARYAEQAQIECKDLTVVEWKKNRISFEDLIAEEVQRLGIKRLGFEREVVSFDLYDRFKRTMPDVELVPTSGIVESLRYTKNDFEIECISKAADFGDEAFERILQYIKPGLTEIEIVLELEYYLGKAGSEGTGFKTILVSGVKTSMPHGVPSDKRIENGDFITIDFGGLYKGYRSDMTRTIVVGKPDEEQLKVYNTIKEAQEKGVAALGDGVVGNVPDTKVREVIEREGYIDWYYPGLGHGVGLELHERPFMGSRSTDIIKNGCVVTMEPGIYIPGWGGVRIEDTVVVREDEIEILTKSPKEFISV